MANALCQLLGIKYPIILGGLAYIGHGELAAAVSAAGGLGLVGAGGLEPEVFRQQIQKARSLTDKPIGANLPIGTHGDPRRHVEVVMEERLSAVTISAGNPVPYVEYLKKETDMRVLAVVSTVRHAVKSAEAGADAVVAEGFEAGGHNGPRELTTLALVPQVARAVDVPVVAAGGIADGAGLVAALALGAQGVQLGTRFVATQECIAHPAYKEALLQAGDQDTIIIERKFGRVTRVLDRPGSRKILAAESQAQTFEELLPLVRGEQNRLAEVEGRLDEGYAYASQAVGLIDSLPTVAEVVAEMIQQAERVLAGLPRW